MRREPTPPAASPSTDGMPVLGTGRGYFRERNQRLAAPQCPSDGFFLMRRKSMSAGSKRPACGADTIVSLAATAEFLGACAFVT